MSLSSLGHSKQTDRPAEEASILPIHLLQRECEVGLSMKNPLADKIQLPNGPYHDRVWMTYEERESLQEA